MKKIYKIILIVITLILIFVCLGIFINKSINEKKKESKNVLDIDSNVNTDDSDLDIDWSNYEEKEITEDEVMDITEEGTYTLSGNINGRVVVNTDGNVKLILDGVDIKSPNGPAIVIENAETVLVYLNENTINNLEDSSSYSNFDEDVKGVIYSKADLVFDGLGTLNIKANYKDGIVSKDDLKIINGTYNIESLDDGIRGKDSVYILDGDFFINSKGDGIKSTNEQDLEKGFILISNGNFTINSSLDGIQAETKLVIENGNFDITTGGGVTTSNSNNRYQNNGSEDDISSKGLKAKDNLVIKNGEFNFNTLDDAIHSNNYVGVLNGILNISSSDDGIHADTELIIDGGKVNIEKSYEGLESAKITINGGNIIVYATDDGINVAGGNDQSSMNRPGENNYTGGVNNTLTINGGTIFVNALGDGIDINGSGYMYGGNLEVLGPTDNGNGILDYDKEFIVDGGTLIASGSSGMLQSISSTKQYNIVCSFNTNYSANTKVSIIDQNNNEVISLTPSKNFSAAIISTSLLTANQTYSIKVNDTVYKTFEITSLTTLVGNVNQGMQNPGGPRR